MIYILKQKTSLAFLGLQVGELGTQLFQLVTGGGLTFVGCLYPYNLYDILGPGKTQVKKWENNHHFLGKRDLFLTFTIHYPLLSLFGQDPTYMNSYIYIHMLTAISRLWNIFIYMYIYIFFLLKVVFYQQYPRSNLTRTFDLAYINWRFLLPHSFHFCSFLLVSKVFSWTGFVFCLHVPFLLSSISPLIEQ